MHRITLNGRALRDAASAGAGPGRICRISHEGRVSECHQLTVCGPARLSQQTDHSLPDPLWLETKAALVMRDGTPLMLPRHRGAIVHVNRALLRRNRSNGTSHPCITVKTMDGRKRYGRGVRFDGPLHLVNDGRQLSCGARAWFTTWGDLEIDDEMSFTEAKSFSQSRLDCALEYCS